MDGASQPACSALRVLECGWAHATARLAAAMVSAPLLRGARLADAARPSRAGGRRGARASGDGRCGVDRREWRRAMPTRILEVGSRTGPSARRRRPDVEVLVQHSRDAPAIAPHRGAAAAAVAGHRVAGGGCGGRAQAGVASAPPTAKPATVVHCAPLRQPANLANLDAPGSAAARRVFYFFYFTAAARLTVTSVVVPVSRQKYKKK